MDLSHRDKMGLGKVEIELNLYLSMICNRSQRGMQLKLPIENFICQSSAPSQWTVFIAINFKS